MSLVQAFAGEMQRGDVLQYVDPFIGTTKLGNTFPAVCRPFGLVKWTPQTRAGEKKGTKPYDYADSLFQGIRWTNFMSGSAVPEYGSMTLMALTGALRTDPAARAARYRHSLEEARPYYYRLQLPDYGVTIEVAATVRAGIFRITFPETDSAYVLLQPNNTPLAPHQRARASVRVLPELREVAGSNPVFRYYIATGQPAGFSGHFVARFQEDFSGFGSWDSHGLRSGGRTAQGQPGAYVRLKCEKARTVLVKIGCSFTSVEQARKNLDAEIPDWDFDRVVEAGRQAWEEALGVIQVEGGTSADRRNFYTALYHALLLPRVFRDADGSYVGFDGDNSVHVARDFVYYDDYSMWDTFRAEHPLLLLIQPERARDWILSLLAKAEQGGWLPIFPAWNSYTSEMIGDHCVSMITDAYVKGFREFDVEKAYQYMRKNATQTPTNRAEYLDGKGRRALQSYLKLGYIPLEDPVTEAFHKGEQVSRTLEYAYDDFCLAVLAESLGLSADAEDFRRRARNYRNVFDPSTGFVRGRHEDGSWVEPFDPGEQTGYITEATPWVYTWFAPHDVRGLIDLMGGREAFVAKLDSFFAGGFYAHDNEPSHHIAYLYAFAGAPWKTQARVRRALLDNYSDTPGGLSGNDDAGQMSAWYIFSAMGFYPVCPGTGQYILGSPIFRRVRIRLKGPWYAGEEFVVEAKNVSRQNQYIQRAWLNGEEWNRPWIPHSAIAGGGRLILEMGPEPNPAWGASSGAAPFSLSGRDR